ncbi:MAG: STAS domain-containing protein [Ktedonobacteraceae bacterium]
MPHTKATFHVRRGNALTSIIDIQGEMTALAEHELMHNYRKACVPNARTIILNFTNLEYMNSSGIGLLVTLLIRINRQKQRLLTYGLNEHYQHIFKLTRLDEVIGMYKTEAEALAASVVA